MLKIKKILNNNAVIVSDEGEEKIAIGPGVAFKKARNDIVNPHKVEKLFVMSENDKFQQLLTRIPIRALHDFRRNHLACRKTARDDVQRTHPYRPHRSYLVRHRTRARRHLAPEQTVERD